MKGIIPSFDVLLKKSDIIRLKRIRNISFAVVFKSKPDIVLNVMMAPFIKQYKDFLFHEKLLPVDFKDLENSCSIDDQKSMQKSLDYILTSEFESLFDLKDINARDNEIAFKNKKNKKIYVVNYMEFINNFKELIFIEKRENYSINLFDYIKEYSTEFTPSEFKKHMENLQSSKQVNKV
ncbi:MAG: hypothetical protein RSC27_04230 [Bacilli bacterium]